MIWVVSILVGIAYLKYFELKRRIDKLERRKEDEPIELTEIVGNPGTYTGHLFTGVKQ